MIAASRRTFNKYGINDRVTLIEGPAAQSWVDINFLVSNTLLLKVWCWIRIKTLTGAFDIIFVDANKDGYEEYVKSILDQHILSARGIILCDNGRLPCGIFPLTANSSCSLCARNDNLGKCKSLPARQCSILLDQVRSSARTIQLVCCQRSSSRRDGITFIWWSKPN